MGSRLRLLLLDIGLVLILLLSLHAHQLHASSSSDKCKFPREWKGRWYQSGLGEVSIRQNSIGTKGVCREHTRDYFLLYNREQKCYKCLLMMKRHKNIIQYKESYCTRETSLKVVCDSIQVEAILYTLVRDPYSTIRCPFQEAYYFNYNDNFAGFCDSPISYVTPCVGGQRFQFHFKHCSSLADMNGEDLNFECVATWKDGSDTYLYGKFAGPTAQTKAEGYRCFKFENYGPDIRMSMSADATCRGLFSPTDGPIVMELSKNTYGWLQPACQFPGWLSGTTWRDLEGKRTYALDSSGDTLVGYYRRKPTSKSYLKSELRCIQHLDVSGDLEQYTMMGFATYDCMSKHQCIKVIRRGPGIVELYQGILSDTVQPDSCMYNREYTTSRILIAENYRPATCPQTGLYFLDTGDDCLHTLDVGCKNTSLIDFSPTCATQQHLHLECVASWSSKSKTYLIASNTTTDDVYNCFSFVSQGGDETQMTFTVDPECNKAVAEIYPSFTYRLTGYPGSCTGRPNRKPPRRKPTQSPRRAAAGDSSPQPSTWLPTWPPRQPTVTWSKLANEVHKTFGSNEAVPKEANQNRNDEASSDDWEAWEIAIERHNHRTSTTSPPGEHIKPNNLASKASSITSLLDVYICIVTVTLLNSLWVQ